MTVNRKVIVDNEESLKKNAGSGKNLANKVQLTTGC